MRRCGRCGLSKPLDDFAWRRREKGQRHSYCLPCQAAYRREHYLANRGKYIGLARARKEKLQLERTRALLDYFASHPCTDCGERDPVVLELDHLRDKEFSIVTSWPSGRGTGSLPRSRNARWFARTATGGEQFVGAGR